MGRVLGMLCAEVDGQPARISGAEGVEAGIDGERDLKKGFKVGMQGQVTRMALWIAVRGG